MELKMVSAKEIRASITEDIKKGIATAIDNVSDINKLLKKGGLGDQWLYPYNFVAAVYKCGHATVVAMILEYIYYDVWTSDEWIEEYGVILFSYS